MNKLPRIPAETGPVQLTLAWAKRRLGKMPRTAGAMIFAFFVESRCSAQHPSQETAKPACLTLFYSITSVVSLSAYLSWLYNQQLCPLTHYNSFVSSGEMHFFPQEGCIFPHLTFLSHINYVIDCDNYCEPNLCSYSHLYFLGISTIILKSDIWKCKIHQCFLWFIVEYMVHMNIFYLQSKIFWVTLDSCKLYTSSWVSSLANEGLIK